MPTLKLTKTEIERLPFTDSGQVIYYDTSLRGFGLRVTASTKTYIVEGRILGKTRRYKIGRHGPWTVETARREALSILKDMTQGKDPNQVALAEKLQKLTLREVYEDYVQSRKLRPKTLVVYESALRRCFTDWMDKPIASITKDMVEKRHREISDKNGPRGKGEAQAHQAMRTLRGIINYAAVKYEDSNGKSIITVNPVKRLTDVEAWNRIPRRKTVIHPHQLKAWAKAVMNLSNLVVRDYLLLLVLTGLRREEAASLKWSDINFELLTITIPGDRTKNHGDHVLPLTPFTVALLEQRRKENNLLAVSSIFVFPGDGKTGYLNEPKGPMKKVIAESGVKFMLHDLRRSFLSIAESLDISAYALKKLANHRDQSDVTAGYIINDVERLRLPMDRISKFIVERGELENLEKLFSVTQGSASL